MVEEGGEGGEEKERDGRFALFLDETGDGVATTAPSSCREPHNHFTSLKT